MSSDSVSPVSVNHQDAGPSKWEADSVAHVPLSLPPPDSLLDGAPHFDSELFLQLTRDNVDAETVCDPIPVLTRTLPSMVGTLPYFHDPCM